MRELLQMYVLASEEIARDQDALILFEEQLHSMKSNEGEPFLFLFLSFLPDLTDSVHMLLLSSLSALGKNLFLYWIIFSACSNFVR